VARAAGLGRSWTELAAKGLIKPFEVKQLQRNEGLVRLIRARLHMVAGRREDRLVFDLQTAVAESFGYETTQMRRASEQLMRRYYWAAKAVTQLNQILVLNIEERINGSQDAPMRPIGTHFFDRAGMLEVASDDLYEREPHTILETFLVYQQTPGIKGLSARTLRALYNAREVMDGDFRRDPANRARIREGMSRPIGTEGAPAMRRDPAQIMPVGFSKPANRGYIGQRLASIAETRCIIEIAHYRPDRFHILIAMKPLVEIIERARRQLEIILQHDHPAVSCTHLAHTGIN
jgi:hypothetical protein